MKTSYRLILAIVALAIFTTATVQAQDLSFLTNGLVAYYPFNGNASDESGNGHHGIVSGSIPTRDRLDNENGAFRFDGVDDFIRIIHSDEFNPGNTLTISFRVLARS